MKAILVTNEMMPYLKNGNGDDVSAVPAPTGYMVTATNPEVERQLGVALIIIEEYDATLRILAK
jgi:hypothetical protein